MNVFIYDNSRAHRRRLEKIIRDYAENNNITLKALLSTSKLSKLLNISSVSPWLYLLNIDDLEKIVDGVEFALTVRNNDMHGSIVFLTEHDIFTSGRSNLAMRYLQNHVAAMSFLAKDSVEYENDIKECMALHTWKAFV